MGGKNQVNKTYKTDSLYSVDTNGGQVMLYEVLLDSYVLPPKEAESEDIPQAIIQALNKDTEQVISNDSYSFNNFDIKAKCKFSNVSTLDLLNKLEYIEFEKGGKIVSIKSSKENALPTSLIIKNLEEKEKIDLINAITSYEIEIIGTNSFDKAQVCSGGVSLEEIKLETMESKIVHNLFITGELLDVDGDCGGYNLNWAWTSGKLAGKGTKDND